MKSTSFDHVLLEINFIISCFIEKSVFRPLDADTPIAFLAAARPKKHPMPSPLLKFEESKQ
jgi:hypothetical protein